MKKILFLFLLLPNFMVAQFVQVPTHFDSENTAKHIMKGHIKDFLKDTVEYVVEKSSERYVTSWIGVNETKNKLEKVFSNGKLEYISRTNGGYIFTIAVVNTNDDTKIIKYCTFHVDAWTQKIEEIEILLGE
jgi:hypothetical protein